MAGLPEKFFPRRPTLYNVDFQNPGRDQKPQLTFSVENKEIEFGTLLLILDFLLPRYHSERVLKVLVQVQGKSDRDFPERIIPDLGTLGNGEIAKFEYNKSANIS